MKLNLLDLKSLNAPLKILDNKNVRLVIIIALIVLGAGIVPMLNNAVLGLLTNPIIKVLMLLLIVYVAQKDLTISLLLAVVYVLMLNLVRENMENNEDLEEDEESEKGEDMDADAQRIEQQDAAVSAAVDKLDPSENGTGVRNESMHFKASGGFRDMPRVMESMANNPLQNPLGYNTEINCVSQAYTANSGLEAPCVGMSGLPGSINAQGMNAVLGNPGPQHDAPF